MVTLLGLFTKAKQVNCGLAEVPMVCIVSMASLLNENINHKYERTMRWEREKQVSTFLMEKDLLLIRNINLNP